MTYILGVSAFYHDSAAALIKDGKIVAAAQEERFTRKKHDPDFPVKSILYCLKEAGIQLKDVDSIVFYEKPLLKFERLLETYIHFAPKGFVSFAKAMPVWLKEKLFLKKVIRKELSKVFDIKESLLPKLLFTEHHQSHAASAFYPSPFSEAAVLCLDGVGEWATTSAWLGKDNQVRSLWQIDFPHSLGMLYSAFTYYVGFKVNSGEYKLMGLAPYGEPKYTKLIYDNLLKLKEDGTYQLNLEFFNYPTGLTMITDKFSALFGQPPRRPESPLSQFHMDIARSIQAVTEDIVLAIARSVHKETGQKNLCLAGGVALNCVANGRILREGPFENIWIQPAAGDAGGAIGAALCTWYEYYGNKRTEFKDEMQGAFLGPKFSDQEIENYLDSVGATYTKLSDSALYESLASALSKNAVVGWFQGRMEFGPRALGGRSIIGDPRSTSMQATMNLKIKFRESFRPFAPATLAEDVSDYFELDQKAPSPYMLLCAPVKKSLRKEMTKEQSSLFGIEKLNIPRSTLPAITHVDYSARVQTVDENANPRFYRLLSEFKKQTGCAVLVNTSFNVRGEPIVCSPEDAYKCFMRTEMDILVLENFILSKTEQNPTSVALNDNAPLHLD